MKPLFLSGNKPLYSVNWSQPLFASLSLKPASAGKFAYALVMAILICGCSNGNQGKIKLHARDSADSAISGHWVLIDSSLKSQKNIASLDKDTITGFILNEDHSATLYKKRSVAIKEMAGNWEWSRQISDSAGRSLKKYGKAIVITDPATNDSIISLNIRADQRKDEPVLTIPNSLSYKKEPEKMH